MSDWVSAVEAKAKIIHAQLGMARKIATDHNQNPDAISEPYLKLLNSLYKEEYPFAQLADSSDLVARFNGPSVDIYDPTVSIVITIFNDIREQIRGIAKSIVGLSANDRVRWPSHLDPQLTGIAHGSLIVGINVPSKEESFSSNKQLELEEISDQIFNSVKNAVRSLPIIARHINEKNSDEAIREQFPDPAIRDTVMVAARKLAPTGRKGIDSVSFMSAHGENIKPAILTRLSRQLLSQELAKPIKQKAVGTFEGVIREVDLDAKRFEIRNVQGIGSIRCAYSSELNNLVKDSLDSVVKIKGMYETLPSQLPRLIAIDSLEVIQRRSEQLELP